MKKITIAIVMALLCLKFGMQAQDKSNITALKIGDQVPDITINNIINYPAKTAKISDFKGKLLILDFWATWCSPCVAMIPKMDSLQRVFTGKVFFLPIAYQNEKIIIPFLAELRKRKFFDLPEVVNDKVLDKLFPHTYLPHYVWIDEKGFIRAITGFEAVNRKNINDILTNPQTSLSLKADNKNNNYDPNKPLMTEGKNGNENSLVYRSLFTKYMDGLSSIFITHKPDSFKGARISFINLPLFWIVRGAFRENNVELFPLNRTLIEVKDTDQINSSKTGQEYEEWLKNNHGFCYEIIVPPLLMPDIYKIMQADIQRNFPQYKFLIEKRKTKCLALIRTSAIDKIATKGKIAFGQYDRFGCELRSSYLKNFTANLGLRYLQGLSTPIIDQTGYKDRVDLKINANLTDVSEIKASLKAYDLDLVEKTLDLDMIVIKDRNP